MISKEFWGVEVKCGVPLKVEADDGVILHISQAALGESKSGKDKESVPLFVKCDGQKLVLGTLSHEHIPQLALHLVMEKEFELSHKWKNGSVYFTGYKSAVAENGKAVKRRKADPNFPNKLVIYKTVTDVPVKPEAVSKPSGLQWSNRYSKCWFVGSTDRPLYLVVAAEPGADSDEYDDSDDEDESRKEAARLCTIESSKPKLKPDVAVKPESAKKRANGSAAKTPVPNNKKAKHATPQKTDRKKCGHTDTHHRAKKEGKSAAGAVTCKSCEKSFVSDAALQFHTMAKHSAAK